MTHELAYELPRVCSLLTVGLDYGEEVHRSRILGKMEQHDRLQNGFFTKWALRYGQDFDG